MQNAGGPERFSEEGTPSENIGLAFIQNIVEWKKATGESNLEKARIHWEAADLLAQKLHQELRVNPEQYLDEVRTALDAYDKLQEGSIASLA